jgi:hypothetical protein
MMCAPARSATIAAKEGNADMALIESHNKGRERQTLPIRPGRDAISRRVVSSLSNIDPDGFPSMAFHSFPDTMKWDPITSDHGLNFFGHAYNSADVVNHPEFGWQAFGGNRGVSGDAITVTPLDSFRMRVYLASESLWLTLDAGKFESVMLDATRHVVQVNRAPSHRRRACVSNSPRQSAIGTGFGCPKLGPAGGGGGVLAHHHEGGLGGLTPGVGAYAVAGGFDIERGASVIPLTSSSSPRSS